MDTKLQESTFPFVWIRQKLFFLNGSVQLTLHEEFLHVHRVWVGVVSMNILNI